MCCSRPTAAESQQGCSVPEHIHELLPDCPVWVLQFIVASSLLEQPPLALFGYQYPAWSTSLGHLIGASSFICIPVYMVYKLVWTPGSLKQVRATPAQCCPQLSPPPFSPVFGTSLSSGPWQPNGGAAAPASRARGPIAGREPIAFLFLLQRLAVCIRPEKTVRDPQVEAVGMEPAL